MFKILDRYIISECWLPFIAGCGIVTGVWLGADQIRDAFKLLANSNADFSIALSIIFLRLPEVLVYTIPVGTFWACFLVFNRLSNDSELIAMRAGGISLVRCAIPAMGFGLIMCLMSFFISEIVVPWTQPLAKRIEFAATHSAQFDPKMKNFIYFERTTEKRIGKGKLKRVLYVERFFSESNLLKNVMIIDFENDQANKLHFAQTAKWNARTGELLLNNGLTYEIPNGEVENTHIASFKSIGIPAGKSMKDLTTNLSKYKDSNLWDIYKLIKNHEILKIETENLPKLKLKFHEKIAYPFSCIVLALTATPLGVLARRSRTNWGYVQTGLLIFMYYASQSSFSSFGESGKIPVMLAAWLPNLILGLIGAISLYRKSRFSN